MRNKLNIAFVALEFHVGTDIIKRHWPKIILKIYVAAIVRIVPRQIRSSSYKGYAICRRRSKCAQRGRGLSISDIDWINCIGAKSGVEVAGWHLIRGDTAHAAVITANQQLTFVEPP